MYKKFTYIILTLLTVFALSLSSCRMLMGDPRKNCNHPEHGAYMKEKFMKKNGLSPKPGN